MNAPTVKSSLATVVSSETELENIRIFISNARDTTIHQAMNVYVGTNPSKESLTLVNKAYESYNKVRKHRDVQMSVEPGRDGLLFDIKSRTFTKESPMTKWDKEAILKNLLKQSYETMLQRVHGQQVKLTDKAVEAEFTLLRGKKAPFAVHGEIIEKAGKDTFDLVKKAEKTLAEERAAIREGKSVRATPYGRIDVTPGHSRAEQIIIARKFILETKQIGLDKAYNNARERLVAIEDQSKILSKAGYEKESQAMHHTAVHLGAAITKFYRGEKPTENAPSERKDAGIRGLFYRNHLNIEQRSVQLLQVAYSDLSSQRPDFSSEAFKIQQWKVEAASLRSGVYSAGHALFEANYTRTKEVVTELNVHYQMQRVEVYQTNKKTSKTQEAQQKQAQPELQFDGALQTEKSTSVPRKSKPRNPKTHLVISNPAMALAPIDTLRGRDGDLGMEGQLTK